MPEAEAVVVDVAAGAVLLKEVSRSCHGCKKSCSKPEGLDPESLGLKNLDLMSSTDLFVGEPVFLDIPRERLISVAFLLYLAPLFGFLAGMIVGNWVALQFAPQVSESCAMIGGLLGLTSVFRCLSSQRVGLSLFKVVPTIRPFR
ncbi:MAG: SoxR reducing system RseC family protein [Methylococcaceae bacterium]|nr:SoxR reducing system RseC family protein [Methylococcaceae bacterium]